MLHLKNMCLWKKLVIPTTVTFDANTSNRSATAYSIKWFACPPPLLSAKWVEKEKIVQYTMYLSIWLLINSKVNKMLLRKKVQQPNILHLFSDTRALLELLSDVNNAVIRNWWAWNFKLPNFRHCKCRTSSRLLEIFLDC